MYKWLGKELEGRSVAEMSILHTLTTVCSLIAILLFIAFVDAAGQTFFLTALAVWLLFVIWLWIGLVRTAWKSPSARLGIPIFRFLQIAVFIMLIITAAVDIHSLEDVKTLLFCILAFDIMIAWMTVNFLLLAWCARCKIPLRAYVEIASIFIMVLVQLWLLN